ncbi:MAG TPA: sigma-70 family RNA polymerase sigma factor [Candidatus Dormibacteraeota bacterium]
MSRSGVKDSAAVAASDARATGVNRVTLTPDSLCELYAGRVFKFAQLISEDSFAAEDLAQDALERAIKGLKTFDPSKGDIERWLWRIVVNASHDAGRIAGRQRLVVELLMDRWSLDDQVANSDAQIGSDEVLAAIRKLSTRHRAVIALRFGADLDYRRVGQTLGITEAAALMATRRALARLRRLLTQGAESQ